MWGFNRCSYGCGMRSHRIRTLPCPMYTLCPNPQVCCFDYVRAVISTVYGMASTSQSSFATLKGWKKLHEREKPGLLTQIQKWRWWEVVRRKKSLRQKIDTKKWEKGAKRRGKNLWSREGKQERVIGREKILSDVVSRPALKVCYITIWSFQVRCRTGLVKKTNTVNDSHMENVKQK